MFSLNTNKGLAFWLFICETLLVVAFYVFAGIVSVPGVVVAVISFVAFIILVVRDGRKNNV